MHYPSCLACVVMCMSILKLPLTQLGIFDDSDPELLNQNRVHLLLDCKIYSLIHRVLLVGSIKLSSPNMNPRQMLLKDLEENMAYRQIGKMR